ncbi:hypothetical protein P3X46_005734 [Hevea brasiliensis]|uniref:Uncharacterized protein n=1 Tax=Hevea brasiliensis TaxID=3981 RepID=A0ABQ9N4R0_HEVBR|nr:hypothetical protein P3X46_005734 [Hevea brasiliensis]
MASSEWSTMFPEYMVNHFLWQGSGHCPIQIIWSWSKSQKCRKGKLFQFECMWLHEKSYSNVVSKAWANASSVYDINDVNGKIKFFSQRCLVVVAEKRHNETKLQELMTREELMWAQRSKV